MTLILVIFVILYGLGFVGGIPAWYRNIRTNRGNCEDVKYAKDTNKWNDQIGEPKPKFDKHSWDLAQYVQGDDPRFRTHLSAKSTECSAAS
jgi:hypothetical protein